MKRLVAVLSTGIIAAALNIVAPGVAATAAEEPAPPATVSADVLPTPQINGVVWSVAVDGNVAYAVGSFTRARPAGVAAGGAGEVIRNNAMAFEINTGKILPWNPNLNAQGRAVEISPDKRQIFVGGDFTAVSGQARSKLAAFDLATGAFQTGFGTSIAGQVQGISITGDTVYVGGSFGTAGGQARSNVAAFNRSNGAIRPWAPTADSIVHAVLASADNGRVVIGGRFQNLNGQKKIGIGAVDGSTGASLAWSSTPIPERLGTSSSWVTNLIEKDGVVYGSANGNGGHWFDGRFAAKYNNGDLVWLDNCYGASTDVAVMGQVMYSVSHAHDCSSLGEFPEENPQIWRRALAETIYPTGTDPAPASQNSLYSGQPIPSLLHWYPSINTGFFTGQYQGGWALANNDQYLVAGGEFTTVNGAAQQGLAVFANRSIALNKIRPEYTAAMQPSAVSLSGGSVRVAWPTTWDYDDAKLTYEVLRDNSLTAIATMEEPSIWWKKRSLGFVDTGRTPGASHTYRIRVKDPSGNEYIGPRSAPVTVSSTAANSFGDVLKADGAETYYPLNETGGTVAFDHAGFNDGDLGAGITRGDPGAIEGNTSSRFDGTANASIASRNFVKAPNTFSAQAWFKTSSTSGGKIVGFGNSRTGDSSSYDRHVWMDNSGKLWFGTWLGFAAVVNSAKSYNDGEWHQVTATLGTSGMTLYVDGLRVAERTDVTSGQDYSGYWRIGGDNMNGWPNQPGNFRFNGNIDEVAIYPAVLDRQTVLDQYTASGRTANVAPAPTDAYGAEVYKDDPSLYWRLEDAAGPTAADASLSGNQALVSGGVTTGVAGPMEGAGGKAFTFDGSSGMAAASSPVANPSVYSTEAWFKTATTSGGKIIGFGNSNTGLSGSYDRHVYMRDDGRLTFGTWTGAENTTTSDLPYNDDNWHHVVATQSSAGMKLYVDGVLVGTHSQTAAEPFTGYWRIGGDRVWGGASSSYFAGTIDEAAVYSKALTLEQVRAHYAHGGVVNEDPTADFTSTADGLSVTFNGGSSADADGTIESYAWDFGDGSTATGAEAQHVYGTAGNYEVKLTVTDNRGATATSTKTVTAGSTASAPTAAFTSAVTELSAEFDASGSTAPAGSIATYSWDFGDGETGTGANPSHVYAAAGDYTVTLTVTDNLGATGTASETVTVSKAAPVAGFTSTVDGGTASFDAGTSTGALTAYAWDFGDGATGSGQTATHDYATSGTYTVTLTVTDADGATARMTSDVTVTVAAPEPQIFASDNFERSSTSGWLSAVLGGAYSYSGSQANFTIADNAGRIRMSAPGSGPSSYLGSVNSTATEIQAELGNDKAATGGGIYHYLLMRDVPGASSYAAQVRYLSNGNVGVRLSRGDTVLAAETVISGLSYAPGDRLLIRAQASGTAPTTLRIKVWKAGTTEPDQWQRTATDETANMQVPGRVGFRSYLSGTATNAPVLSIWDNIIVSEPRP